MLADDTPDGVELGLDPLVFWCPQAAASPAMTMAATASEIRLNPGLLRIFLSLRDR
jgi:hypothetical protein